MKKTLIFCTLSLSLILILTSSSFSGKRTGDNYFMQDTTTKYKDGVYEGMSRASYTDEPYWGIVHLTLSNGKFTDVRFMVRDSNLHETFDALYEKHFVDNPEYVKQSRNDWKGVQIYPKELAKKQDINKVDVVSGATWSYDIFKASVQDALKKAR